MSPLTCKAVLANQQASATGTRAIRRRRTVIRIQGIRMAKPLGRADVPSQVILPATLTATPRPEPPGSGNLGVASRRSRLLRLVHVRRGRRDRAASGSHASLGPSEPLKHKPHYRTVSPQDRLPVRLGSPALLMICGRRRSIPSPSQPISNRVPGAVCCFRSSCWALPKGAASSTPVLTSRTSPSIWRPPPPRRPAPSAAPTPAACTAATPAGSTTCPVSAGACGFSSPSAASSAHSLTAHDASSPSASRGSPHRGHGPPTGSGRPRRTSARRWAARPVPASPHAWRITTSPDTLLRRVKGLKNEPTGTPRVVGIDDWAWRKGQCYGTIVVDLERSDVIDLLPDRDADTVAAWLKAHPGIEVVSRDRSGDLRRGGDAGCLRRPSRSPTAGTC